MKNDEKVIINRLPAKTWYWLNANDAKIDWDVDKTVRLPEETIVSDKKTKTEPVRIHIEGKNDYTAKTVKITAKKGNEVTVYMDYKTAKNLAVRTEIEIESGARVKLVQIQNTKENSLMYNEVYSNCAKDARFELIQIFLGKGNLYSDSKIDLAGDGSSLKADIGYIGQNKQNIDINIFANHTGKKTECEINSNGALKDAAKKVFKGTIDFKRGASDSIGNEQETVLMLGDDVVNKTIPLILCAEENVVGNHGATIGQLDEDTLFYFESRGIDKATAENIMARAAIEHLAHMSQDEEVEKIVVDGLKEVL